MDFLQQFEIPVVFCICLCVGYIIKKWIKDVDNKWIPTILFFLGALLAVWLNDWNITAEALLGGIFSGLSSTGCHQLFKQLIENRQ